MRKSREKEPSRLDAEMSLKSGLYFYSIIALSVGLPVVVALCVMFMDIFVTILISTILLSVLIGLIILYRRVKRQLDEFCNVIESGQLLEGDHEISILGGLLRLKVEDTQPLLPPPGDREEESAADQEASL